MTKGKHGGSRVGAGRRFRYGEPAVQKRIPSSGEAELNRALDHLAQAVERNESGATPYIRHALELPLYETQVPAGLPTDTGAGQVEAYVDLNDLLGVRPGAQYLVRVTGESMIDAGIQPGDVLSVRQTDAAKHGDIVVADVDGGVTVKRFVEDNGRPYLKSENADQLAFSDVTFAEGAIKGVVCGLVRSL